jgi:hypothetical protein
MMPDRDSPLAARPDIRPYVPIAILTLAFLVAVLQQTVAALGLHSELLAATAQQQASYDQALSFRNQLENIAAETARLAAEGDPAAETIEQALRQNGIDLPPSRP